MPRRDKADRVLRVLGKLEYVVGTVWPSHWIKPMAQVISEALDNDRRCIRRALRAQPPAQPRTPAGSSTKGKATK